MRRCLELRARSGRRAPTAACDPGLPDAGRGRCRNRHDGVAERREIGCCVTAALIYSDRVAFRIASFQLRVGGPHRRNDSALLYPLYESPPLMNCLRLHPLMNCLRLYPLMNCLRLQPEVPDSLFRLKPKIRKRIPILTALAKALRNSSLLFDFG